MGFTFDDARRRKERRRRWMTMRALIAKDPRNAERIFPYIGGEEVNTDPRMRIIDMRLISLTDRSARPSCKHGQMMVPSARICCWNCSADYPVTPKIGLI